MAPQTKTAPDPAAPAQPTSRGETRGETRAPLWWRTARGALQLVWRIALLLFAIVLVFLAYCAIGLIPVNNDFLETEDGVEIFVTSNGVHTNFVLPVTNEFNDWSKMFPVADFASRAPLRSHIEFGWGDRGFYVNTPTWNEMKASTALWAACVPSDTVVHVVYCDPPTTGETARKLRINAAQYKKLCEFIRTSFAYHESPVHGRSLVRIGKTSYGYQDAFYEGSGAYHLFNTCNCWTGRGLKATGVRTALFTPFSSTVFYYLPSK